MTPKQLIQATLITGLSSISFGGWLLRLKGHPLYQRFFQPFLFWFRHTVTLTYLLESFSIVFGAILMARLTIVHCHPLGLWVGPLGPVLNGVGFNEFRSRGGKYED